MIVDNKQKNNIVGVFLIDGSMDGAQLAVTRTPTKLRRFFARVFFGWKWASLKQLKKKDDK